MKYRRTPVSLLRWPLGLFLKDRKGSWPDTPALGAGARGRDHRESVLTRILARLDDRDEKRIEGRHHAAL